MGKLEVGSLGTVPVGLGSVPFGDRPLDLSFFGGGDFEVKLGAVGFERGVQMAFAVPFY